MTALVLMLAGVTAGDGGVRAGAATAPVAVDLGGRWVGTYQVAVGKTMTAELNGGVLRIGANPAAVRYRFTARRAAGLEGPVLLVPDIPIDHIPAIYKVERGRLVICCSQTKERPTDFSITPTTALIVLKPAARKP
jgi:hypothetical protein